MAKNSVPRLGVGGNHIGAADSQDRSFMKQHHMGQGKLTSPKPKSEKSYGPGEWAALGIAGGLTGLAGAAVVGGLRQGFGGGGGGDMSAKKTK